jgi:SAM-dependent methyltransferase
MRGYRKKLAYIHDAGFGAYALGAAPGLLRILRRHGIDRGFIVDLGCGSGRWARELTRAGYDVLGIDQSPAMIRLARKLAPASQFKVASLWNTALPLCSAITSMGECLNYRFDEAGSRCGLASLFERVYGALKTGGLFISDFATLQRKPVKSVREHRSSGKNWKIISTTAARGARGIRRTIVTSRKVANVWRHGREVHDLRLYTAAEFAGALRRCGFRVRIIRGYGRCRFPRGIAGVIAVKPVSAGRRR